MRYVGPDFGRVPELSANATRIFFASALLPDGWHDAVCVEVDGQGDIASVAVGVVPDEGTVRAGIGVPGVPNAHSHAFQRGLVGLCEKHVTANASFWSWREQMYALVAHLTPSSFEAIAAQAYVEMLEAGFTSVAEFHYLHHASDGRPYGDLAEMSGRILAAAQEAGIGLTLLPVLYSQGGIGGAGLDIGQRPFFNDFERYMALLSRCQSLTKEVGGRANVAIGCAAHSLRAVGPEALKALAAQGPSLGPLHLHIAEQADEVKQCLAWSRKRPVAWLLDNVSVDRRWTLVHATHTTEEELHQIVAANATVCIAPSTEANLGDGLFDAATFVELGGRLAIGTDANVRIDAAEELRWLEYGQRLRREARHILAEPGGSTGSRLLRAALHGGQHALGHNAGSLTPGLRADIVALDPSHPLLAARTHDQWLDAWIFSGDSRLVQDVWVGGRQWVANGMHVAREGVRRRFERALTELAALA